MKDDCGWVKSLPGFRRWLLSAITFQRVPQKHVLNAAMQIPFTMFVMISLTTFAALLAIYFVFRFLEIFWFYVLQLSTVPQGGGWLSMCLACKVSQVWSAFITFNKSSPKVRRVFQFYIFAHTKCFQQSLHMVKYFGPQAQRSQHMTQRVQKHIQGYISYITTERWLLLAM